MRETTFKALLALILAAAGAYLRELLGPLIVLAAVMVADYITGMAEAWVNRTLSSRIGIVGIIKKLSYLIVVGVAIVVDWIIQTATARLGLDLGGFYLFGLLVCIWLIINECISILENIAEIGGPKVPFLQKILDRLKKTAEEKGEDVTKGGR